jgi:hypothetical protein
VLSRLATDRVEIRLQDGTPVLIRPIGIDDRELIRKGFDSLSEESRRRPVSRSTSLLTEEELDYLTHLDYWDHFACGAIRADGSDEGIAVARYIRLPREATMAEAAVTVVDRYQRRGLGKAWSLESLRGRGPSQQILGLPCVFPSSYARSGRCWK